MDKRILNTLGLLLIASLCLTVWGGFGLCRSASIALDKWGNAANGLNTSLEVVNPVIHKADIAFGNLADATGDWSDSSKQQARDVRALLAASGRTLDAVTEDAYAAKTTLHSIGKTADAGTGSLYALTDTLGEGKRTIAAAQPLLASYTRSGDDLDALLKRKAIGEIMDHAAGILSHTEAMTADGHKVADKATADYFRPTRWYMQPIKKSGDIIDIGAAIARHTP